MKNTRAIIGALVLCSAVTIELSYAQQGPAAPKAAEPAASLSPVLAPPPPVAPVAAVSVHAQDAAGEAPAADIRAQLVPKRFAMLAAEIPGRIDRINFKEGEQFKENDVLLSIDCSLQAAQLDEARATLSAAEKTKSVNKRLVELNSGGVLEADVAAAEAAKAQAKVNSAQALLSKCTIKAPYDGRVADQKVREQQYVQPGVPLMEIIDGSSLEVEFIAPSSWLAWMKVGTPFQIKIDETGKTYPAAVQRTGAKVDAVSHSVKMVGKIDGDFPALLAGMSGSRHRRAAAGLADVAARAIDIATLADRRSSGIAAAHPPRRVAGGIAFHHGQPDFDVVALSSGDFVGTCRRGSLPFPVFRPSSRTALSPCGLIASVRAMRKCSRRQRSSRMPPCPKRGARAMGRLVADLCLVAAARYAEGRTHGDFSGRARHHMVGNGIAGVG